LAETARRRARRSTSSAAWHLPCAVSSSSVGQPSSNVRDRLVAGRDAAILTRSVAFDLDGQAKPSRRARGFTFRAWPFSAFHLRELCLDTAGAARRGASIGLDAAVDAGAADVEILRGLRGKLEPRPPGMGVRLDQMVVGQLFMNRNKHAGRVVTVEAGNAGAVRCASVGRSPQPAAAAPLGAPALEPPAPGCAPLAPLPQQRFCRLQPGCVLPAPPPNPRPPTNCRRTGEAGTCADRMPSSGGGLRAAGVTAGNPEPGPTRAPPATKNKKT